MSSIYPSRTVGIHILYYLFISDTLYLESCTGKFYIFKIFIYFTCIFLILVYFHSYSFELKWSIVVNDVYYVDVVTVSFVHELIQDIITCAFFLSNVSLQINHFVLIFNPSPLIVQNSGNLSISHLLASCHSTDSSIACLLLQKYIRISSMTCCQIKNVLSCFRQFLTGNKYSNFVFVCMMLCEVLSNKFILKNYY